MTKKTKGIVIDLPSGLTDCDVFDDKTLQILVLKHLWHLIGQGKRVKAEDIEDYQEVLRRLILEKVSK